MRLLRFAAINWPKLTRKSKITVGEAGKWRIKTKFVARMYVMRLLILWDMREIGGLICHSDTWRQITMWVINFREGEWGKLEINSGELIQSAHGSYLSALWTGKRLEGLKGIPMARMVGTYFPLEENAARLQSTCRGYHDGRIADRTFQSCADSVENERTLYTALQSGASFISVRCWLEPGAQVGVRQLQWICSWYLLLR